MHTSHDFIATKTCPSCEFLVVFRQVQIWDRKSVGQVLVGMVCGVGWVGSVQGGSGQDFSNSCGAGADKKFQPT